MTIPVGVVAADGAKATVQMPTPVVAASGTPIAKYSDFVGTLNSIPAGGWKAPSVDHLPQIQAVSTPYGPGWAFVVADTDHAIWYSTPTEQVKAVLLQTHLNDVVMGQAQSWEWYVNFPTQTVMNTWHTGLFFEFHTSADSGHNFALDNWTFPGHIVWRVTSVLPGGNVYAYGPLTNPKGFTDVTFDTWHHFRMDIKWSLAADGWKKVWIDGVQYQDFTGATVPTGVGTPYCQFGYYSDTAAGGVYFDGAHGQVPVTNRVTVGGVKYSQIPA
jgi:hypothetical protein